MKSPYYRNARQLLLIPYIEAKCFVSFDADEVETVKRILALSPRALKRVIAGEAESFRNTEEHIRQLNFSTEAAAKHRKKSRSNLIDLLTHDLISDHIDHEITSLLVHHDLVATKTHFELKIASRKSSYLQLRSSWITQVAKAAGPIKAGQLVSSDEPGAIIEGADAMMAMQEWESAIQTYDFIAAHWPETDQAFGARNNQAVCLMALGRFDEAIAILEPILEKSAVRELTLKNLARCFASIGDAERARATVATLSSEFGESAELVEYRKEIDSIVARKDENS
jgi:hypothetical protein